MSSPSGAIAARPARRLSLSRLHHRARSPDGLQGEAALRSPASCCRGGTGDHRTGRRAAAGHGHLRAADAGREHMVDTLKAAFVQGGLTKDELDARAGQALTARTYAELAALTADIPAGPPAARPARQPARPWNR